MQDADAIARLQAELAGILTNSDPMAALRASGDPSLQAIDADGLRIAALLVAKLRFERLMNGSRVAHEWFERDAREFTEAFRSYHHAVPLHAGDPWQEAAAFESWLSTPH